MNYQDLKDVIGKAILEINEAAKKITETKGEILPCYIADEIERAARKRYAANLLMAFKDHSRKTNSLDPVKELVASLEREVEPVSKDDFSDILSY